MTSGQPTYKKILVATDFSPPAEAALQQALWLARKSGAQIVLAHILPDLRQALIGTSYEARMDLVYGEGDLLQRELRQESDAKMQAVVAQLGATDVDIKFETLIGDSSTTLTQAVQAEGYDLVVTGTRGLSSWEKFFVGSTAKQLIRSCPADVWTVKPGHVGAPKVVLAVTDFSDASLKAAQRGFDLAQQAGAAFHVLHIMDAKDAPEELLSRIPQGTSVRQAINDEAKRRLDAFVGSLSADSTQVQSHLSLGTPWQEIKRMAEHLKADLIAIGTVGRRGLQGMLLGNTAERVLNHCECSILTVKPDGFVSPIEPAFWKLHPTSEK